MRISLISVLIMCYWYSACSQASTSIDVEYQYLCLIDSLSPTYQVEFVRRQSLTDPTKWDDWTSDLSNPYVSVGTYIPCFRLTGTSECWYRNESVSFTKYSIDPPNAPSVYITNDLALVGITYSDYIGNASFLGTYQDAAFVKKIMPLNYPYINTDNDSLRIIDDITMYLDCIGADMQSTKVAVKRRSTGGTMYSGLQFSIEVSNIKIDNAIYSFNSNLPGSEKLIVNPSNTSANYTSRRIGELYRKENGSPYYFMDYKGNQIMAPISGLVYKVPCTFESDKIAACNKPSGSTECWISKIDTPLCNYYLSIPYYCKITGIYSNGSNVLPSGQSYIPNDTTGYGTLNRPIWLLSLDINAYIEGQKKWGEVSVNNQRGKLGFIIHINNTDIKFDSVTTASNGNFYFDRTGCNEFRSASVSRNDLGGILTCVDEFGKDIFLDNSFRKINCNDVYNEVDCQNKNRVGGETIVNTTKVFDLSKYNSFYLFVITGTATYTNADYNGNNVTTTLQANYNEKFEAKDLCKYLKGKITITTTGTNITKVTYIW